MFGLCGGGLVQVGKNICVDQLWNFQVRYLVCFECESEYYCEEVF